MATLNEVAREDLKKAAGSATTSPTETAEAAHREAEVREKLYVTFNDALDRTKQEVRQMQAKLKEYDERFKASETVKQQGKKASDFLRASLEEIKASLDSLSNQAHTVFIQAKELSADAVANIYNKFNEAVNKLRQLALEFDEKYQVAQKVSDLLTPLFSRLKLLEKSLDQAKESVKDMGKNGRTFLINAAANIETKYHIESRLSDLDEKYKIVEKAKQLQERGENFIEKQHLREKVANLDERITGSKAGTYIGEGVKLVKEELGKLQEEFAIARENSRENLQEAAAKPVKASE